MSQPTSTVFWPCLILPNHLSPSGPLLRRFLLLGMPPPHTISLVAPTQPTSSGQPFLATPAPSRGLRPLTPVFKWLFSVHLDPQ